jgi:hypothetical protein
MLGTQHIHNFEWWFIFCSVFRNGVWILLVQVPHPTALTCHHRYYKSSCQVSDSSTLFFHLFGMCCAIKIQGLIIHFPQYQSKVVIKLFLSRSEGLRPLIQMNYLLEDKSSNTRSIVGLLVRDKICHLWEHFNYNKYIIHSPLCIG